MSGPGPVDVVDAAAWDAFVASSQKPHIFQSWAWGELKSRSGWRPRRWVWTRDGRWRAGLSFLERDLPLPGRRLFYAPRGPVVAEGWEPADLAALFGAVEPLARSRGAVLLKIDPDVTGESDWATPALAAAGFRPASASGGFAGVQPRCVFRLDISRPEEELLLAMDQKTRYNIRLSEKRGVTIRETTDPADIATFHGILRETGRRDGFLVRPISYFNGVRELLAPAGQARFFLAEAAGKALAGTLALRMGPVCWYAYGASSSADRHYMPNHLLQWTMIRWAKSQGCRLYDFRAVPCDPSPSDPLHGLYRFKKGFGATFTRFVGEYDRSYSPLLYAAWNRGWPVFKSLRRWMRLGGGTSRARPAEAGG
jgi:lipid II:glycine glycyltransferase (peptidoglycan interpeptide bridge formation enzyme)